jgi:DNA polymerase-3 subunit epsilon
MQHDLQKIESGYQCKVCTRTWKAKPRASYPCPGVTWYANYTAPEHLKTEAQLRKMKLKPGAPRRAIVEGRMKGRWDLFDVNEAVPLSEEEIAAIREKARQAQYKLCIHCQTQVRREKWDREYEVCHKCLPAVLERETRIARERKDAQEREFQDMLVRDRNAAIEWAQELLARDDWVILDTETTGLESDAEIISITIMSPAGEILLDTLLKPSICISQDASAVNGITDEMVADAPLFSDIFTRIQHVLAGKLIVAYNADFDERMLMATCYRYKVPYKEIVVQNGISPWQCAMIQYAAYFGEWNHYYGNYRWQKLPKGDHTAKGDCLATLGLIHKMAWST